MKKYKNVKARKACECCGYIIVLDKDGFLRSECVGIPEPFKNPTCNGYKCKCTEYKYNKKEGALI